jgi:hypothetical protein
MLTEVQLVKTKGAKSKDCGGGIKYPIIIEAIIGT